MSRCAQIQDSVAAILAGPNALRVPVPIVARRAKDLGNDIEAAVANHGLCAFVLPPLPQSALQNQSFVTFDKSEVIVRFIEQPAKNSTGVDAFALRDDAANALQWQPTNALHSGAEALMTAQSIDQQTALQQMQALPLYAGMFGLNAVLSGPLELAARPSAMVEDKDTRIVDLFLNAVYGLPVRTVAAASFAISGNSCRDLQAAALAQLAANLPDAVKILPVKSHDLANAVTRAADSAILCCEVLEVLPTRAMTGVPFVFYEAAQLKVRVSEEPNLNQTGVDAYALIEEVATALHWQPFAGLLSYPIQLSRACVSEPSHAGPRSRRVYDVSFDAVFSTQQS